MSKNEEEASERSRESVDSLQTIGDAESTGSEAQRRRSAFAWARSERALDVEQERTHAGVVTHSMEGNRLNSLWGAMNVIEGGQGTSEDAKEVREKVVAAVEERWKAGENTGAPAAGGNRMAGVRTEDVTREKDGRATGFGGIGDGEWIPGEGVQGDAGRIGLQEDTGVWRGERSKFRNLVEEDEGVRGGVGA